MKKFAKLIPAMAMLLISAILVSTSTFAWFSMNTQVTANGMQVVATAESSLNIKVLSADNNTYGSEASVQMSSALKLKPTSTSNLTQFFRATAANYNQYNAKDDSVGLVNADAIVFNASSSGDTGYFTLTDGLGYVDVTSTGRPPITAGQPTGDAYALVAGYDIKLTDGQANTGLNIQSIKISGVTASLSNSIRVGVIMVNGNTVETPKIVAPTRVSGTDAGSPYSTTSTLANPNPTIWATTFSDNVASFNTQNTQLGVIGDNVVQVYIFVYFEGQDNNNTSYNYDNHSQDNLSVVVTFATYTNR